MEVDERIRDVVMLMMNQAKLKNWPIDESTGDITDSDLGYSKQEVALRNQYRAQLQKYRTKFDRKRKLVEIDEEAGEQNQLDWQKAEDEDDMIESESKSSRLHRDAYHISAQSFVRPAQEALIRLRLGIQQQGIKDQQEQVDERMESDHVDVNGVFIDHVTLRDFTAEDCEAAIAKAMSNWCPEKGTPNEKHPLTITCEQFNLEWDGLSYPVPPSISIPRIQEAYRDEINAIMEIMYKSTQAGNYTDSALCEQIARVSQAIFLGYRSLLNTVHMSYTFDPTFTQNVDDPTVIHFRGFNTVETTQLQNLIIFLLKRLYENSYIRYKNAFLYSRVYNDKGQFVHAYSKVCPIEDWVWKQTDMFQHFDMWCAATASSGAMETAIKHLQYTVQPQLPNLKKDRYVISFYNGIYLVKEDAFISWEHGPFSSRIISCNYIPQKFKEYNECNGEVDWQGNETGDGPRHSGSPWDIPTPSFDKVLIDQGFSYQVIIWFYVLFGRLMYWTRDQDHWQVWPFMHGRANTGKSTFCKLMEQVYDPNDTEIMSNKIERQFGLWPMVGKFVILAPEVGKDFSIDKTDLQAMITGESVSVKAKNKKAFKVNWDVPGIMSGNEIPGWKDTQGAMPRRLIIFEFTKKIQVDQMMDSKLRMELPNILLKCNRFYRAAIRHVGSRELWCQLPDYFKQQRTHLQGELSSIHAFLASDEITVVRTEDGLLDETVYMPLKSIRDLYREWKQANEIREAQKWEADLYTKAFTDTGLSKPVRRRLPYPRDTTEPSQKVFVLGIDSTNECERLGNIR